MTGKLAIGDGLNYKFDPKRAKAVSEGLTQLIVADASGVADPVLDGSVVTLQWEANYQPIETSYTAAGDTALATVLGELASWAELSASVALAAVHGTGIELTPAYGYRIESVAIVVT